MNTPLPGIRDIAVPRERGALRDAIDDLERKLTAFTKAVHAVEALLERIAHVQGAPAETGTHRRPMGRAAKAVQTRQASVQEAPPSPQESQQTLAEGQAVAAQEPRPRAEDAAAERPADKKAPLPDARPEDTPVARVEQPATGSAQVLPQETAPAASEDEVLMASLDEATCKAIKMMRRLDPHKPLKELLKRIEEQKDGPGQAAKPAGRSWFKRR